jgi:hypothetical protein
MDSLSRLLAASAKFCSWSLPLTCTPVLNAEAPSAESAMAPGFPDTPWPREALADRSRFPSRERAAASTRTGRAHEGQRGAAAAQADLLAVMELASAVRNLGNFSINFI